MKALIVLVIAFLCSLLSVRQQKSSPADLRKVDWLTLDEALERNEKEPKKIFIDLYTNWCGWCKRMDATTFEDPKVVAYMNQHYYCVKLNAETKDTLTFRNRKYFFKPEYKANEFAVLLLKGQMSYPTAVYMEADLDLITPVAGYQTPEQMLPILKYIGDDVYLSKSWEEYSAGKQ